MKNISLHQENTGSTVVVPCHILEINQKIDIKQGSKILFPERKSPIHSYTWAHGSHFIYTWMHIHIQYLHPEYTIFRVFRNRLGRSREAEAQNPPGISRVDDTIVP